jgi:glycosyltransferase involved in cell wall biosynthesis
MLANMSRVLIDARESGTSTGRYIDKLIEYLAKSKTDLDFSVITKPHRRDFIKKIAPGFDIETTEFKEFTFGEQLGLKTQIEAIGADLVHFGMVQQPVLLKTRVVTTIHDLIMTWENNPSRNILIHKSKQQIYKQVIKRAAKKSVSVITPTNYVKDDLIKFTGINSDKVFVTYESGDFIKDIPEEMPKLKGKQFVMYIGRPMPHKNLERLIEAFVLLKKDSPKLVLVLAGKLDFNYNRIKAAVESKVIPDVMFTDFVSEGQLRWLYENCAAYVFPSLSEGFGLPGLEAMAHGAPVVSSNATCLPEVYGNAAKYFNPTNVVEMASVINEVINSKDLREELVANGTEQLKKYSWAKMAKETLDIYEMALSKKI